MEQPAGAARLLSRPIFIIGVPRSGTSMLYTILSSAPQIFSLRAEGRFIWQLPPLRPLTPAGKGWESGVLTAEDAALRLGTVLEEAFYTIAVPSRDVFRAFAPQGTDDAATFVPRFTEYLRQRNTPLRWLRSAKVDESIDKSNPLEGALEAIKDAHRPLRFVEKTPANCLRVGFINALFPDALFIYLKRDGRGNVNSLMEGWKADASQLNMETFGYRVPLELSIPGIEHQEWRYILPPGWREYRDKPLEEVATFQWMEGNRIILDHLGTVDPARVHALSYEDLVDNTADAVRGLCAFIGVPFEGTIRKRSAEPPVRNALTPPEQDKWMRQNREAIERMVPTMAPLLRRMGYPAP